MADKSITADVKEFARMSMEVDRKVAAAMNLYRKAQKGDNSGRNGTKVELPDPDKAARDLCAALTEFARIWGHVGDKGKPITFTVSGLAPEKQTTVPGT